jgi:hypothetical protein
MNWTECADFCGHRSVKSSGSRNDQKSTHRTVFQIKNPVTDTVHMWQSTTTESHVSILFPHSAIVLQLSTYKPEPCSTLTGRAICHATVGCSMITALFQWYILISTNQCCPHDQQTWTFFWLTWKRSVLQCWNRCFNDIYQYQISAGTVINTNVILGYVLVVGTHPASTQLKNYWQHLDWWYQYKK